ncbi:hypothetical protein AGMMS50284_5350 [Clostridia bacterium]|nr:hypothetical protein AGMMS50284_5350 [Clostridia bacterium]
MGYGNKDTARILRAVLIGTITGILSCTALIMLSTIVFLKMQAIPTDAVGLMTQVFGALSAFIGGYVAVRIAKEKGLLLGITTGLTVFLIVLLAGLFTTTETISLTTVTKAVAMGISGSIGGVVGVNKKKRAF